MSLLTERCRSQIAPAVAARILGRPLERWTDPCERLLCGSTNDGAQRDIGRLATSITEDGTRQGAHRMSTLIGLPEEKRRGSR